MPYKLTFLSVHAVRYTCYLLTGAWQPDVFVRTKDSRQLTFAASRCQLPSGCILWPNHLNPEKEKKRKGTAVRISVGYNDHNGA